jgi:Spy/CpxP family protein refolding chaperone
MIFKSNRLKMMAMLCIACLFVLVPIALAQNPPQQDQPAPGMQGMRPPGGPGMGMRRPGMGIRRPEMVGRGILRLLLRDVELQKQLNVTDEQRKKLEDIVFNNEKAGIQERANLQIRRLELQRLTQADTPDRAAIDKKLQEVAQAQAALMRAQINGSLDFRAVLTKEQRDKIREAVQKRMPPMQQQRMMQPRPGRPGMMPGGNPPPERKPGN